MSYNISVIFFKPDNIIRSQTDSFQGGGDYSLNDGGRTAFTSDAFHQMDQRQQVSQQQQQQQQQLQQQQQQLTQLQQLNKQIAFVTEAGGGPSANEADAALAWENAQSSPC